VDRAGSATPPPRGCAHRWDVVHHARQHGQHPRRWRR
jgi:hypothetical protein